MTPKEFKRRIRARLAALFTLAAILFAAPSPARAAMEDFPRIKLQSLDKVTARTMTFEADVGSTIKFGKIYVKIQACRKAPPIEQPEAAAFLQIWEITPEDKAEWIFSGWMFASSPALSPMDHPIYDVWVLDCLGPVEDSQDDAAPESEAMDKAESSSDAAAVKDLQKSAEPHPDDSITAEPLPAE